jgi:phage baseplate assembly protein W
VLGVTNFPFPLAVRSDGLVGVEGDGDVGLRGRVLQVLFTAPGERVNLPEFGCGLFDLVFDPNNEVLAAATQFSIGSALMRWLGDEIIVANVGVTAEDEKISIEIVYARRADLVRQTVRVHFR